MGKEALSGLVPGAKPDKSKQKEKKAELAIQEISFEELNRMNVKKKTIKAGRRAVLLGKQGRLLDAVRENTKVDEKETDEGEIQEDTAAQKKVTIVEIKPPVV